MPGMSTTMSSTTPAKNSHGAAFCHAASGTWKAAAAGDEADGQENAVTHQEIGRLMRRETPASAIAIDAE